MTQTGTLRGDELGARAKRIVAAVLEDGVLRGRGCRGCRGVRMRFANWAGWASRPRANIVMMGCAQTLAADKCALGVIFMYTIAPGEPSAAWAAATASNRSRDPAKHHRDGDRRDRATTQHKHK